MAEVHTTERFVKSYKLTGKLGNVVWYRDVVITIMLGITYVITNIHRQLQQWKAIIAHINLSIIPRLCTQTF